MAENKDGTEKTEEASAKRLQDAREKGQVAKSHDLTTAGVILIGGIAVFMLGRSMILKMRALFLSSFSSAGQFDFTDANIMSHLVSLIKTLAETVLPIMFLILAIALIAEISQVGFKFATKKWSDPETWSKPFKLFSGVKRVFFSSHSIIELLKGSIKILILGGVAYAVINDNLDRIMDVVQMPFEEFTNTMSDIGFEMLVKVGGLFAVIAFGDFMYQRWKFKQDMKMTKQEVKEENKQLDGDVQAKARLRQMGRAMLRKKMVQNVPKADVVVVNPTHFAVAISYKQDESSAPVVVAKGVDYLALKIREIASQHNVEIVEDPPLARTLYKIVEVDQEIPEVLFKAVAGVLAYVYQLKSGKHTAYNKADIDESSF